jgi:PAS domain S-box-containing protein
MTSEGSLGKTIMVVDDHQPLRESLRALLLEAMPDCSIIEAADGEEAIKIADTKSPDIVIMDIGLPGIDGIETTKIIHARKPELKVVMLSLHEEDNYRQEAKLAGASAYVSKRTMYKDLVTVVKQALKETEERLEQKKVHEKLNEYGEKYKSIVENIGIGVSVIGPNMEILDINKQMKNWFPDIDVTVRPHCYRVFNNPPKEDVCLYCPTCKTLLDGQIYEAVTSTPAGNVLRHYRIISSPLKDADDRVTSAIEMVEDITERLKMETELRESEKRYRTLFDNMFEGVAYCRMLFEDNQPQDFIYIDVNSAFERLTGLKDVVGRRVTEVIPGIKESNPELFEIYGRVTLTGKTERFETFSESFGGWLSISVYGMEEEYFVAIFENITERRRAEQERDITIQFLSLVNESACTRDLIEAATTFFQQQSGCEAVGVRLHEGDDYPYYEARGFSKEFVLAENSICAKDGAGGGVRDSVGNSVIECMCGNIICGRFDPSKPFFTTRGSFWTNSTTELLANTTETDRQTRTRNRCNGEGYESVALIPMRVGEQRLGLLQLNDRRKGVFYPETIGLWERLANYLAVALAKLQSDEALRRSDRKYHELFTSSLDCVYRTDTDGFFTIMNPAGAKIFGRDNPDEIIGRNELEYWRDPKDREAFRAELNIMKKMSGYRMRAKKRDGEPIELEASSRIIEDEKGDLLGIEGILRDITERNHLEAQLRHAQKMEAIGSLAGGIAHDFNNILNVIIGYGSMVLDKLEDKSLSKEQMNEVLAAAERAANLTKRLFIFSRQQLTAVKPTNVKELITDIQKMLVRLVRENIDFKLDLTDTRLVVMADAGQIEQVLMNLVTNADDAMANGGRLTIGASLQKIEDKYIALNGYGVPGMYALITVADTGHGMDTETQKKIFEPFFTTKGIGEGTGLGLAISYGIVKQHNGYIKVYSEPGQGTVFKIYLPLIEESTSFDRKTEAPDVKGGNETILVAEDDASLNELIKIVMESFGYSVITAKDGEDAITKFIASKERIHLVMIDMIMPKKNGKEVSEVLRKTSPDVKILFLSGYTMDIIKDEDLTESGFEFIHKPISPQDLLRKVREVLDK